jgi:hypothetical protein
MNKILSITFFFFMQWLLFQWSFSAGQRSARLNMDLECKQCLQQQKITSDKDVSTSRNANSLTPTLMFDFYQELLDPPQAR